MIMENKTYDFLKQVAGIFLPALATLIIALGEIWGWTYAAPVAGTIMAIDTALGKCLEMASDKYNNRT